MKMKIGLRSFLSCGGQPLTGTVSFAIVSSVTEIVNKLLKTEGACTYGGQILAGGRSNGRLFIRVMQHKAGEIEGFFHQYKCTRLVYYESFDDVKNAIATEKQLKGWRRSKKIALIEKANPRWQDLAEHWGEPTLIRGQSTKANSLKQHCE